MDEYTNKIGIRGSLAIGGGTLIGIGVGFAFLRVSALLFVACLLAGLGLGLVIAALIPGRKG